MNSSRWVRLAVVAAAGTILLGRVPARVAAQDPLAGVKFAVGDAALFEAASPGGGTGYMGRWSFERGRMIDGRLELHLEIEPAPQQLPVRSGPAVLFAGLHLYGDAGGDVGIESSVPTLVHKLVPACADDSNCHYSVDVAIPTDEIPAAIRRLERSGDLIWVSATFTLVRTYGAGQWLEVIPLLEGRSGIEEADRGRLGAMEPAEGELFWSGLSLASEARPIPPAACCLSETLDYAAIAERLRVRAGDTSEALELVDVTLDVRLEPACTFYSELWLHDDHRDHLFNSLTYGKSRIERQTKMPVGVPWYLTLSGGGGVAEPAVSLGPIRSDGSPVEALASFDCNAMSGTLRLTGAADPTAAATAARSAPTASVGLTAGSATQTAATTTRAPADAASTQTENPSTLAAIMVVVVAGAMIAVVLARRRVSIGDAD